MKKSIISAIDLCLKIRNQRPTFWPCILIARSEDIDLEEDGIKSLVEVIFDEDERIGKLYVQVNFDTMESEGVLDSFEKLTCRSLFHENDDEDDHYTWVETESKDAAASFASYLLEELFNFHDYEDVRMVITGVRATDEYVVMDMDGAWRQMVGFSDIENK